MKKVILASVLSLVLLVAFGSIANAQLAKEGKFSIIEYGIYPAAGAKVITMGEERLHCIYEVTGTLVNDAGKGFLHNAGSHWLGQLHAVKGVKELETGFVVYTDADGDKVYLTYDWKGIAFKSSKGFDTMRPRLTATRKKCFAMPQRRRTVFSASPSPSRYSLH